MTKQQTKQTLQQMKKIIAYLRVELEMLSEKVDKSLEKQKRLKKQNTIAGTRSKGK